MKKLTTKGRLGIMKKKCMGMILGIAILGAASTAAGAAGTTGTEKETETGSTAGTEMEIETGNALGTEMDFMISEETLVRNEDGRIVGVDVTNVPLDDTTYESYDLDQLLASEQFREYEKLGLTYNEDERELYFAGMVVVFLGDNYKKGTILDYTTDSEDDYIPYGEFVSEKWFEPEYDDKKLISVDAVRDEEYHLLYFEFTDVTDNMKGSLTFDSDEFGTEEMPFDWFAEEDEMAE